MKKLILGFLALLPVCPLTGQVPVYQNVIFVSSAPSGACTNGSPAQIVISTGSLYTCQAGTWGTVGGGSSSVSLTATTPIVITPSPTTGTGVISCPTCATSGSSGAMANITGTVTVANCTLINSSSACQVQGSPVGSITFSSIPGTYNDLQLRCTYAAGSDVLQAVINADSTSGDYGIESMEANAAAAGTVFAATGGITFWPMAETANTTSWATAFVADFGGYANTTFFKNYHSSASALTNNGAVTQMISWVFAGVWTNTAAITSIKLAPSSSNIKVGSQCSLYGVL